MTAGEWRATLLMRGREAQLGNITIRNIDDSLLQALEERASAAGRSLEDEARQILEGTVQPEKALSWEEFWRQADQIQASFGGRTLNDSTEILRELRDERLRHLGEP